MEKDLMTRFAELPGLDDYDNPVYGNEGYDKRINYAPQLSKWYNGYELRWAICWVNMEGTVADSVEMYTSLEETIAEAERTIEEKLHKNIN